MEIRYISICCDINQFTYEFENIFNHLDPKEKMLIIEPYWKVEEAFEGYCSCEIGKTISEEDLQKLFYGFDGYKIILLSDEFQFYAANQINGDSNMLFCELIVSKNELCNIPTSKI